MAEWLVEDGIGEHRAVQLDGDRIESLRTFDPDTQRSSDQREEVVIIPVREASLADLRAPEARRAVSV